MLALDVDAVAQDDKHAAALFRRTGLQHLFSAGIIDRIIERLPASCLQGPDLLVQRLGIVSKILEHRTGRVKRLEKDLVLAAASLEHVEDKFARRVLLEGEFPARAVARVQDQADAQGRLGAAVKVADA